MYHVIGQASMKILIDLFLEHLHLGSVTEAMYIDFLL